MANLLETQGPTPNHCLEQLSLDHQHRIEQLEIHVLSSRLEMPGSEKLILKMVNRVA